MSNRERVLHEVQRSRDATGEHVIYATNAPALSVTVVFTTVAGTLEALRQAGRLAAQLGLRIRVLVPSVVPYPLDLARPRVDPLFRLRHFRTLWEEHSVQTFVDVRLCRDRLQCIREALAPHSLVLMAARSRSWPWPSEKRFARELQKDGHEVILFEAKTPAPGRFSALGFLKRFPFGVEHDNLADVQTLHSRLDLRGVSDQQK